MKSFKDLIMLMVTIRTALSELDSCHRFCGDDLSQFLGDSCDVYPTTRPPHQQYRFRRGITEECCTSPCSKHYLLCAYCQKTNKEIVCPSTISNMFCQNGTMEFVDSNDLYEFQDESLSRNNLIRKSGSGESELANGIQRDHGRDTSELDTRMRYVVGDPDRLYRYST